jgi:hypothetical protein
MVTKVGFGGFPMSVMNIELPDDMHRRFAATAAACGVSMKQAVVAATRSWIEQHALEAAEALGFSPAPDAPPKTDAKRRAPHPAAVPAEPSPARVPPPVVVVVAPLATDGPVEVAAPAPVADGPVEPAAVIDRWKTADELLRDDGHPACQHGVLIGASAALAGSATVAVESE